MAWAQGHHREMILYHVLHDHAIIIISPSAFIIHVNWQEQKLNSLSLEVRNMK